ncbi:MAG: CHASE domain-containing protein, partial [Candidatus Eisenbacteria bacterium]|nr:CHASE domain-containing protein [Candidatus Eisenbacteria bacterium]
MRNDRSYCPYSAGMSRGPLNVLVALAYVALAWLGLRMPIDDCVPAYFWPATGFTLATWILYGRRAFPGLLIGALAFALLGRSAYGHGSLVDSLLRVTGELLQPIVAVLLLRRSLGLCRTAWLFDDPVRFLALGGPVASLVGASFVALGFHLSADAPTAASLRMLLYSSLGLIAGTWVVAPAMLAFLTPPASAVVRVWTVVSFLISISFGMVAMREERMAEARQFESQWSAAAESVAGHVDQVFLMLQSTASFFASSNEVEEAEFARFTHRFLAEHAEVSAIGFAKYVSSLDRHRYENPETSPAHPILERNGSGRLEAAATRPYYLPVDRISCTTNSRVVFGYDLVQDMSANEFDPAPSLAPSSSGARGKFTAFVPAPREAGSDKLLGVAFAEFEMDQLVADALGGAEHLDVVLDIVVETASGQETIRVGGTGNAALSGGIPAVSRSATGSNVATLGDVALVGEAADARKLADTRQDRHSTGIRRTLDVAGVGLEMIITPWTDYGTLRPPVQPAVTLVFSLLAASLFTAVLAVVGERKSRIEDLVHERTDALRIALDRAQSAHRAKSAFLANMSHEIRTPLNGVMGMIDLLRATTLVEEQRSLVDTMHGCSSDLLRILNDVLDMSKIESGQMECEEIPISLREISSNVIRTYEQLAQGRNVLLESRVDEGVPDRILGDPTRIAQILRNLVSNAIRFTDEGSVRILVSTEGHTAPAPSGDEPGKATHVVLRVVDTGTGIPSDKLESIFEPFTQADSSTTRLHGGTGLGLSIVKKLVHTMGGRLSVESAPGRGSTFQVTLPLRAASASQDDPAGVGRAVFGPNARVSASTP